MSDTEFGSFEDLASIKGNEVEKPQPLPAGHYTAKFTGSYQQHKSPKKGTLAARYEVVLLEGHDDVDLSGFTGDLNKPRNYDFWLSPNALFMFTDFAEALGLDMEMSIPELIEAMAAYDGTFVAVVEHEPNEKDPDSPYSRIRSLQVEE